MCWRLGHRWLCLQRDQCVEHQGHKPSQDGRSCAARALTSRKPEDIPSDVVDSSAGWIKIQPSFETGVVVIFTLLLSPMMECFQVWFPGAHSDVGGGYERQELADISVYWMAVRLYSSNLSRVLILVRARFKLLSKTLVWTSNSYGHTPNLTRTHGEHRNRTMRTLRPRFHCDGSWDTKRVLRVARLPGSPSSTRA